MRWALVCLLSLAGCSAGTRSPEGAVRALIEAGATGDREDAWRLLSSGTRRRLESDARRAAMTASRRDLQAIDLLAVGWFPARFHVADVREVERSGDHAVVEVRGTQDERERLSCVREDGRWKVEVP